MKFLVHVENFQSITPTAGAIDHFRIVKAGLDLA